jgi:hypothetical protein
LADRDGDLGIATGEREGSRLSECSYSALTTARHALTASS